MGSRVGVLSTLGMWGGVSRWGKRIRLGKGEVWGKDGE